MILGYRDFGHTGAVQWCTTAERKEQRRRKRPRVTAEEQSEGKLPKPNWRIYKARQRARKRQEKEKTSSKIGAVAPNDLRGTFVNKAELNHEEQS